MIPVYDANAPAFTGLALRDAAATAPLRPVVVPLDMRHAPAVRWHFETLSPASRSLRFGTPRPRIDDALVAWMCDGDGHHRSAWGAFVGSDLAGTACLVRLTHDPRVAEFALTVLDRLQGRGLGRLLLRHVAAAAAGLGIRGLAFYVSGENRRMLRLLSAAGVAYRIRDGAAEGVAPSSAVLGALDGAPGPRPYSSVSSQRSASVTRLE